MDGKELGRETFVELRNLIYEKSGIYFQDKKGYLLRDRLKRRLEVRNLSTFEEYLFFLRYDPAREEELKALFDSITTNETSFFRDMNQLEAFKTGVLPKVMERKGNPDRSIKIWSAGCSTGEEPYTIAIMLDDMGLKRQGWRIDILASDISDQVLSSARRGIYRDYAVRNTPDGVLKRYFINSNGVYTLKPEIKEMVRFKNINLVDHLQMRMVRGMDVVFCRNVLIYFDDRSKKKALGYIYDSLVDGGFLIVGFSESLIGFTRAFKPVGINGFVVYQKV